MQVHWIGYAQAGKEFVVQDEIKALGIDCHVPRRIDVVRKGRRGMEAPITSPALMNYIFITGTMEDWHLAQAVKGLSEICIFVSDRVWQTVEAFCDITEADYEARTARIMAGDYVGRYAPGEVLRIVSGPLAGQLATFSRMVGIDQLQTVRATVHMLGRDVLATLDPMQVKTP
jgi:transcription antitermination factor NusG